ncbi:MAG: hypothetical protein ACFFAO_20680 [Candidatus Hermodarchaeota archaeon]
MEKNRIIDYFIGLVLITGVILVLLGYSLLINLLTVTDHLAYSIEEWNELLERVDPGTSARLDFGLKLFMYGIIITVVGNGIALARIFIKRDMDKKMVIDYSIGVILITGAISVIFGISYVYYTLVTDNIWDYFYLEYYEIEKSMSEGTVALFYSYLYLFMFGIIISIIGNGIALARIFIKKTT